MFRRWRRIDKPGLELARITISEHGVAVSSTLIDGGEQPFSLRYAWTLTPEWVTRTLRIEQADGSDRWLTIERVGDSSWRIDGAPAPHLDGCEEIDVSGRHSATRSPYAASAVMERSPPPMSTPATCR